MRESLLRSRTDAFRRQAGRCYYCTVLMWSNDLASFARAHALSHRAARWLNPRRNICKQSVTVGPTRGRTSLPLAVSAI